MFKSGQWIYGIEFSEWDIEDGFDEVEPVGYLYMAECGDYIICCSEYSHHAGDFESQLAEMCEASTDDCGVDVNILRKEFVFDTLEKAQKKLKELKAKKGK